MWNALGRWGGFGLNAPLRPRRPQCSIRTVVAFPGVATLSFSLGPPRERVSLSERICQQQTAVQVGSILIFHTLGRICYETPNTLAPTTCSATSHCDQPRDYCDKHGRRFGPRHESYGQPKLDLVSLRIAETHSTSRFVSIELPVATPIKPARPLHLHNSK